MTKREWEEWASLRDQLATLGIGTVDAERLRKAARTLHRWAELECGDERGDAIERDEVTGKPYRTYETALPGKRGRYPIADREAGALRRIRSILEPLGLHFYHQTDPRGASLYVAREPMTDSGYSTAGIAVY